MRPHLNAVFLEYVDKSFDTRPSLCSVTRCAAMSYKSPSLFEASWRRETGLEVTSSFMRSCNDEKGLSQSTRSVLVQGQVLNPYSVLQSLHICLHQGSFLPTSFSIFRVSEQSTKSMVIGLHYDHLKCSVLLPESSSFRTHLLKRYFDN